FGGLAIATAIVAVMYIGMCYSIAEMAAALPHTGGAYSFARTSLGPWGGYITGLAENIEYVLTPAVVVVGIAYYMGSIFTDMFGFNLPNPVWWAIFYAIFVGLNVVGVEATFKFTIFITFLALAILGVFWIGAVAHFDFGRWALNIGIYGEELADGHGPLLPFGWSGVTSALPFAIWFYLAIEQLPLAAEESHDPKKDMPRGLLWGILTLIIASVLTLLLNAGIAPGAKVVGESGDPLFLAFKTIFGEGAGTSLLGLVAVAGLVASFHTIIYAYGRNIYSLSRAGYFPKWLSVTHGARKTPHVALITGAVIGYIVCLILEFGDVIFGASVGAALLNMAVFGAVIAYIMQMIADVKLKTMDMERPYESPLGKPGAIVAGLVAVLTLAFLFISADYRAGVYGVAVWFLAGLLYFAFYARHRMILSPEEEFARRHRQR
ncbi:MAG: amino acid permease, partial [Fimbriimonadaceae bacterium]|nr:amino acid permease [Alphaproteobacteria bacterium]